MFSDGKLSMKSVSYLTFYDMMSGRSAYIFICDHHLHWYVS